MNERLQSLYDQIPAFECIPGCTDCCGPVPWARDEMANISGAMALRALEIQETEMGALLARGQSPADICVECPFSQNGCRVYEYRPFICRLFGTVDDPRLKCPHGRGPKRLFTAEEAHDLTMQYIQIVEDEQERA